MTKLNEQQQKKYNELKQLQQIALESKNINEFNSKMKYNSQKIKDVETLDNMKKGIILTCGDMYYLEKRGLIKILVSLRVGMSKVVELL